MLLTARAAKYRNCSNLALTIKIATAQSKKYLNPLHFKPPETVPFSILLCLTPDDFTCQGKSPEWQRVNPFPTTPAKTVHFSILLCLTPDDFTCQRKSPEWQRVNPFPTTPAKTVHFSILLCLTPDDFNYLSREES